MNQPSSESSRPLSFEESLHELEAIVRELEAGDTTLEEALARYEQGVGLLKSCYGQLRSAEQRVLLLSGEDADGRPVTQPFEHPIPIDSERPGPRRRPTRGDTSY